MNFGNLGIALGAGVNEWNNQRRMAREDAAEQRQAAEFAQRQQEWQRQNDLRARQQALLDEHAAMQDYAGALDTTPDDQLGAYVQQGVTKYNTSPYYKNGMFAKMTVVDGQPYLIHDNATQSATERIPLTRESIRQGLGHMQGMLRERLAMLDPQTAAAYMDRQEDMGLKRRQIGTEETKANAALRNVDVMEGYRADQRRLLDEQIRTGNWGATGLHQAQAGYYNRMPREGAAGAGGALDKQVMQGITEDGQLIFSDGRGNISTKPIMINGQAATPEQVKMFKRMYGAGAPQLTEQVEQKTIDPKTGMETTVKFVRPQGAGVSGPPKVPVRENPLVFGGSGGFTPSGQRVDVTRPSSGVEYVSDPTTGGLITRDEYERRVGDNQSLVGRGLRFLGVR